MQPVFILSSEASGMPALVRVLNANGVTCLGAAFDIDNRYEYSLAYFLESRNVGAVELFAAPDVVLDEYLTWCAELVHSERFCLDVDIDFLHLFNGRAFGPGQRPHLVDHVRKRRFRVVHFSHRGVFEEAVRLQLRQAGAGTGGGARKASEPFVLNIPQCERWLRQNARIEKRMEAWFQGYRNHVKVIYEDVFERKHVSERGASLLGSLFGREIGDRTLHGADVVSLDGLVGNAHVVIEAFADTPYAEEVQRLLAPVKAS